MAQRNTATLVYLLEKGRMSLNELTRKERKAVEKSMSVSKQLREYQSQTQINQNQYTYKKSKPKNVVKAEKVGLDWSFSEQGYKHLILTVDEMIEGTEKEVNGFLIHKVNDNEAVLYQQ